MYEYKPSGVCSQKISFDLKEENGKKYITNVSFVGGCSGNTQGIARLIEGMEVGDAISRIEGIKCGYKSTSCPDQLSKALRSAIS